MLMTTTENIFAPTPDRRVKRGWMNLRVSHVIHETPDTDTFLMVDAEENKRAFDYIAGQYLTFRFDDVADKDQLVAFLGDDDGELTWLDRLRTAVIGAGDAVDGVDL